MKNNPNEKIVRMTASDIKPLSSEEIERYKSIPDSQIDFSDIPELDSTDLKKRRAVMISLRLEQELLDWFKRGGPGYQTRIRRVLRAHIESQDKSGNQAEQIADAVVRRLQAAQTRQPRPRKNAKQPLRRKSA